MYFKEHITMAYLQLLLPTLHTDLLLLHQKCVLELVPYLKVDYYLVKS
jgi:hypothetical protein